MSPHCVAEQMTRRLSITGLLPSAKPQENTGRLAASGTRRRPASPPPFSAAPQGTGGRAFGCPGAGELNHQWTLIHTNIGRTMYSCLFVSIRGSSPVNGYTRSWDRGFSRLNFVAFASFVVNQFLISAPLREMIRQYLEPISLAKALSTQRKVRHSK